MKWKRAIGFTLVELPVVSRRKAGGFTLVELLVVIGIITVLIGILLTALSQARRSARDVQCANNMRQVSMALRMYAQENDGRFPPNSNDLLMGKGGKVRKVPCYWYDADRIGKYLPRTIVFKTQGIGTGALACPEDNQAVRSYAMNIWASSAVDVFVLQRASNGDVPPESPLRGTLWTLNTKSSSQLILLGEKFSGFEASGMYACGATVGFQGDNAGSRFGAAGGTRPLQNGRFGTTRVEIDYSRHRRRWDGGSGVEPKGRLNFAFADGHVAMFTHGQLADFSTGLSKLTALWSPFDAQNP